MAAVVDVDVDVDVVAAVEDAVEVKFQLRLFNHGISPMVSSGLSLRDLRRLLRSGNDSRREFNGAQGVHNGCEGQDQGSRVIAFVSVFTLPDSLSLFGWMHDVSYLICSYLIIFLCLDGCPPIPFSSYLQLHY